jgi:hypothetical protein
VTVVWDKFSIYTIVQQVKEEWPQAITEDQLANFVYGEISIARPAWLTDTDWPAWFTIMDRNLWAIKTWAWVDPTGKSYWYHYQWWNNYWFDPSMANLDSNYKTGNKIKIPEWSTGYYGKKFVYGTFNKTWMQTNVDTLRWWENDSSGNGWWVDLNNSTDRQWPCPNWWHVPSAWEWW